MPLRKRVLLWLLWPLPGWTPVCSPLGLARHPSGGPGLRRAWTDGAVEGGSWKHTQPVEEPATKMAKLNTQSSVGQREKGQCQLPGEPKELTEEGQPGSPALLTCKVWCFAEMLLFSFEFERITEPREFNHLVFQIMRLVITSLPQRGLPARVRRS